MFKTAEVEFLPGSGKYTFRALEEKVLASVVSEKGRAMELSDLVLFGPHLLTFDDRTGLLLEISKNGSKAIPRHIMMDGDGNSDKGFKGEWATVKDGHLYIGGLGKEWTDGEGKIVSSDPCWVKVIGADWSIRHENWTDRYLKLRQATGHVHPGYLIHEAVHWDAAKRRWIFLPRRASFESYNDVDDETRATNLMILASEDFADITTRTMGPLDKSMGFSSFKPVPGNPGHIAAVKTEEVKGEISSTFMVLNLETGALLMEPVTLGGVKFEGVEFLTE